MATSMLDNDPIWHYYSNWTSRIIGRVEINDLEYPRGQKCFHPGDETVFGEGFTTQILHVLLIDSQFGGFWVAPLPTLPTKNRLWTVSKNGLRMVHLDSVRQMLDLTHVPNNKSFNWVFWFHLFSALLISSTFYIVVCRDTSSPLGWTKIFSGSGHRPSETFTDCLGPLRSTKSLLETG